MYVFGIILDCKEFDLAKGKQLLDLGIKKNYQSFFSRLSLSIVRVFYGFLASPEFGSKNPPPKTSQKWPETGEHIIIMSQPRRFAFIFPMASGHLNPSLPVARALVEGGHQVSYLCREQMRDAIEGTGAEFHDEVLEMPEMYEGRSPDMFGALTDMQKEYGLENENLMVAMMKLKEIMSEMMLPGILRWLKRLKAQVVVCCPLMNRDACLATEILKIPCVGLLTTAGPGSMASATKDFLHKMGLTVEECLEHRKNYQPLQECFQRLRAKYNVKIDYNDEMEPIGKCVVAINSIFTLVTTAEFLADPLPENLREIYEAAKTKFIYVGPLLDKAGAKRAAGHKFKEGEERGETTESH